MRTCRQCQNEMIKKPKVAICPSCGEISLYIENIDRILKDK